VIQQQKFRLTESKFLLQCGYKEGIDSNMAYVLVNKVTGVRHGYLPRRGSYATLAAARAALTRYQHGRHALGDDWHVMLLEEYSSQVPVVMVRSLMSNQMVSIPADQAGGHMDPSTETYWSM
jgi:hypothetical protein